MTKSQCKKAAMDWLRSSPIPWPAVGMYPAVGPASDNGERVAKIGYIATNGMFIRVVTLYFGETTDPLFVKDRRHGQKTWPPEALEAVA